MIRTSVLAFFAVQIAEAHPPGSEGGQEDRSNMHSEEIATQEDVSSCLKEVRRADLKALPAAELGEFESLMERLEFHRARHNWAAQALEVPMGFPRRLNEQKKRF